MKIAILVPCYNVELFLPKLFEGINAQTVPFDEIICYDDFSSDNTVAVAKQLGAKVISGAENKGAAYARNRLIEATDCAWIHFHDADDLISPLFVETMKKHIQDENIQLLCNTNIYDLHDQKNKIGTIDYSGLTGSKDHLEYFLNNVGFASMGLYSKKALIKINGFNEFLRGNEDPDLHIRLIANNFKILNVSVFLVAKIERSDSFSHQNWFQCLHDKFICLKNYSQLINIKYHKTLGMQAAMLSNFFYRENDKKLSLQARTFAYRMGARNISTSKFASFVSRAFGLKFYLWTYRRRIDLKGAFKIL